MTAPTNTGPHKGDVSMSETTVSKVLHSKPARVLAGIVGCSLLFTACGGSSDGLPSTSSNELKNIVKAVDTAHPHNTWWHHVTDDITGGFLADAKIYTNYKSESVDDMAQAVALCDAFIAKIHDDSPLVVVYGSLTTTKTKIDGTKETDTNKTKKLAEGDDQGCDAYPYYKSVEAQLEKRNVSVHPFETEADAPDTSK